MHSSFKDYISLRLILNGPTTNQVLSKGVEAAVGGVITDIKIENFDIAFGNQ